MDSQKIKKLIKITLYATILTPVVTYNGVIFPFVFPKTVFFRGLVSLALALFVFYLLVELYQRNQKEISKIKTKAVEIIKNPLFLALGIFLLSFVISTIFADNPYRAFWGDVERAEGLFGILHYFVFALLVAFVFKKDDWVKFFKFSLGVGIFIIFIAFLEFFGLKFLIFEPPQKERVQSYIGNSAFLATYLFFVLVSAVITILYYKIPICSKESPKGLISKSWLYLSLAAIPLSAITIFMTGTRGAMIGLISVLVVFLVYISLSRKISESLPKIKGISLRQISSLVLVFIFIFSGFFLTTMDSPKWQKVPGLSRMAELGISDREDPSTAFRLITWELSWEAFKEKPLLGWGPENFLNAYQAHYDPSYAIFGDAWLDRAHNAFLDALVMRGALGFLVYLGLFVALFYLLLRRSFDDDKYGYARAAIVAIMVGYVIQNIFVFDQIISFIFLFALFGLLISGVFEKEREIDSELKEKGLGYRQKLIAVPVLVFIAVASVYSLYAYNYIPFVQAKTFKASPGASENVHVIVEKLEESMTPYNFAQLNIRAKGIDVIYMGQYFENLEYAANPNFRPLGNLLIDRMAELIVREPYDTRLFIRLTEMFNGLARAIGTETDEAMRLYRQGEGLLREAARIAPKRQDIYYHLSFNLGLQGNHDESIELAQYAVDLEPRVARSHYFLALAYGLADMNEKARETLIYAEEKDPSFRSFKGSDIDAVVNLYSVLGEYERVVDMIFKTTHPEDHPEKIKRVLRAEFYETALTYFIILEEKESLIQVAKFASERFPETADDMEVVIDLAEKDMWQILQSL